MPIKQDMQRNTDQLHQAATRPLTRDTLARMRQTVEHLGDLLHQADAMVRGRLDLTDDLWPELDEDDDEEDGMAQSERDRLLMFRDAIEDAGVSRGAREDALRRMEQHFADRDVDRIDARSFLDTQLRRQAPHLWPQGALSSAPASAPAPPAQTAREQRKAPLKRALTAAELADIYSLRASAEQVTVAREWEKLPLGTPHPSAAETLRGLQP